MDVGANTLNGGTGAEGFVFTATADSAIGAADIITDFVHCTDRIDLSAVGGKSGFCFRWLILK